MTRKVSLEKFAFTRFQMPCGKAVPLSELSHEVLSLAELFGVPPDNLVVCPAIGDSMIDEDIHEGDLLFADNSLFPQIGDVVLAEIDGEMAVKKIDRLRNLRLVSCNAEADYKPIEPQYGFHSVGVVIGKFRFNKNTYRR